MRQRRIKVTVCNVSMQLSGDVLAAYLCDYGDVESVTQIKSVHGTAYSDHAFIRCLTRGGFQAIPHTIKYKDQTMMVVVEGRKPLCWACKKLRHFARSCPQKNISTTPSIATAATTTTTKVTNTVATTGEAETGNHPSR